MLIKWRPLPTPRQLGWLLLGTPIGGFAGGLAGGLQFGESRGGAVLAALGSGVVALAVTFLALGQPTTRTKMAVTVGLVVGGALVQASFGRGPASALGVSLGSTALFFALSSFRLPRARRSVNERRSE